mmetsp:Transcript_89184/g.247665  ORF Transcript_89184/g.247665 Transcript_89184/m.247665 type:complete len:214 (+) Transcript_89184:407-1048(+)
MPIGIGVGLWRRKNGAAVSNRWGVQMAPPEAVPVTRRGPPLRVAVARSGPPPMAKTEKPWTAAARAAKAAVQARATKAAAKAARKAAARTGGAVMLAKEALQAGTPVAAQGTVETKLTAPWTKLQPSQILRRLVSPGRIPEPHPLGTPPHLLARSASLEWTTGTRARTASRTTATTGPLAGAGRRKPWTHGGVAASPARCLGKRRFSARLSTT